jgi:predicted nucleic acid-binding protein
MTFLVDANVLCEPTKPFPVTGVVDWLTANEADLVIDAIVLGEIAAGILSLPAGRKRTQVEKWFEDIVTCVECLPWDVAVSRRWARLVAQLRKTGRAIPLLDSMIAATALEHGLTVATRNVRDFEKTGVAVFDPFA